MSLRPTHELHDRRRGRNLGVAALLLAFAALMFGITVAKLDTAGPIQGFDHVVRPELLPQSQEAGQ